MMIDFLAWGPQHFDHMKPIWEALPKEVRGTFYINANARYKVDTGSIQVTIYRRSRRGRFMNDTHPVLVSTTAALREVNAVGRKSIAMTHDAGDTLLDSNPIEPMYLMGYDCHNTILFLSPGYHLRDHFKRVWPNIEVEVIGCPKLDKWHINPPERNRNRPIVCVSFTWDWMQREEIRGAWSYFGPHIKKLLDRDWELVGNAHPKMLPRLEPIYKRMGIPVIRKFDDVIRQADVYVIDRSSTMFEFASVGKPVVVLDPPWYFNVKEESLRFWKAKDIGLHCTDPEQLGDVIEKAIEDPPEVREARERTLDYVYPIRDGSAARHAAQAILRVLRIEEQKQVRESVKLVVGEDDYVSQQMKQTDITHKGVERGMTWIKATKTFKTSVVYMTENGPARMIMRGIKLIVPDHVAQHYIRRKFAELTDPPERHEEETQPKPGPSETQKTGPSETKEIGDSQVEAQDEDESDEEEEEDDDNEEDEDEDVDEDEEDDEEVDEDEEDDDDDEEDEDEDEEDDEDEDDSVVGDKFYCVYCDRHFKNRRGFNLHLRQVHSERFKEQ